MSMNARYGKGFKSSPTKMTSVTIHQTAPNIVMALAMTLALLGRIGRTETLSGQINSWNINYFLYLYSISMDSIEWMWRRSYSTKTYFYWDYEPVFWYRYICYMGQFYIYKRLILRSLTLIREFLEPSPSAFSEKKSRIIAGDVTVGTLKMKIIRADTVSVGLSYDTNFKWHMPI